MDRRRLGFITSLVLLGLWLCRVDFSLNISGLSWHSWASSRWFNCIVFDSVVLVHHLQSSLSILASCKAFGSLLALISFHIQVPYYSYCGLGVYSPTNLALVFGFIVQIILRSYLSRGAFLRTTTLFNPSWDICIRVNFADRFIYTFLVEHFYVLQLSSILAETFVYVLELRRFSYLKVDYPYLLLWINTIIIVLRLFIYRIHIIFLELVSLYPFLKNIGSLCKDHHHVSDS